MRLLLDTHIWIWRLIEPARLSTDAESAIAARESELFLSSISTFIVATALELDLTLVTADSAMHTFGPVQTLW